MKPIRLSVAQYAAHKEVNEPTVRRWIKDGVISAAAVKVKNAWKIDPDEADKLHAYWMQSVGPKQLATIESLREARRASEGEPEIPSPRDATSQSPLAQAKTAREIYQAKLAQLEYEQKSGKLCRVEEVEKERFATARMVRNAIMALIPRLTPNLRAMDDHHDISNLLTEEFTEVLMSLDDALQRE